MKTNFLLKDGTIVTTDGQVRVDLRILGGTITEIGEHLREKSNEVLVDCSHYFVFPGLINSHDHLEFNLFPRLGTPPYANAYEWGHDLHRHWKRAIEPILRIPLRYRLWWGAWKNLFSGVTTVVHHNTFYREFKRHYPLTVPKRYTFAHSLHFEPNLDSALRKRKTGVPFIIHLAEGKDNVALREVAELQSLGGLDDRTVGVHCVALRNGDIELLQQAHASMVWCPSSNLFLFGKTALAGKLFGKIRIALGTDSTLTGSSTMFDELRIAKQESGLSSQTLFHLVTDFPQAIFRLPSDTGKIIEGSKANLFLLHADGKNAYDCLLEADVPDIDLVIHDGNVRLSSPNLMSSGFSLPGHRFRLGGKEKLIHDRQFKKYFEAVKPFLGHYPYLTSEPPRISVPRTKKASATPENFICPSCRRPLQTRRSDWICKREGYTFKTTGGIPDFILPDRRAGVEKFLRLYHTVRADEQWGSQDIGYYIDLPYRDRTGQHSRIWAIRAKTFDCFLEHFRARTKPSCRILDLGAGNCWLSHRLAHMGHHVVAVDVNTDSLDGLAVATRLQERTSTTFQCVRAEFDRLPFPDECFDHIVFNASLHYSKDPVDTINTTLHHLKSDGILWILDSPLYKKQQDAEAMIDERIEEFRHRHNLDVARDCVGGYLTFSHVQELENRCRVEYIKPHYGLLWRLRPMISMLLGRRKPATFLIIKLQKRAVTSP